MWVFFIGFLGGYNDFHRNWYACVVFVGVAFILGWRMFLRRVKDWGFAFLQLMCAITSTSASVPCTKIYARFDCLVFAV